MMKKVVSYLVGWLLLISQDAFSENANKKIKSSKRSLKELILSEDFGDGDSIWESKPLEIHEAKIQILDKISGKVFKQNIRTNQPITFGTIILELKRCFKNSPEDSREVYAFIEISEDREKIFSNWLFASAPSINLPSHPVYDFRIEFE